MEIVKPTAEQIAEILKQHALWLKGEGGQRANLYGANLYGANLSGANLSSANLSGANLYGANLSSANLSSANLSGANLSSANLSGANLSSANLSSANLSGADLRSANLSGANLYGADLRSANLSGADLRSANLSSANLSGANLYGAKNAELASSQTEIVPREGEVIGWKKCRGGRLVKLRIPPDAKRSNATGRKCRATHAEVISIQDMGGNPCASAVSMHDGITTYIPGQTVRADGWGENRFVECAPGIHFFLTIEEAQAY